MFGFLKRFWVAIIAVVALLVAVAVVGRLRTFFDSDRPLPIAQPAIQRFAMAAPLLEAAE